VVQIDSQEYLDLLEDGRRICFFDIEAIGLRGDYNSVVVVSVKGYDCQPVTFAVKQVGNDERVVRQAKKELESFNCICGYYSKGFDIPMLNTRLLKWGHPPIEKRPHLDLYYGLKANLLTSRRSQGHLLAWLGTPEQKMGVSASVWADLPFKLKEDLPVLVDRCESDVAGLEALYKKTRHLIREIKR
jgi:uncharacterized protein YprB with RNaseH-like and TPR domain